MRVSKVFSFTFSMLIFITFSLLIRQRNFIELWFPVCILMIIFVEELFGFFELRKSRQKFILRVVFFLEGMVYLFINSFNTIPVTSIFFLTLITIVIYLSYDNILNKK